MILPTLRGYYTVFEPNARPELGNHILIGCKKCKCQLWLYHKENCKNAQTRFPAFCLKCGSMIVVEVRKVKGGDRVALSKKGKPVKVPKKPTKPAKPESLYPKNW